MAFVQSWSETGFMFSLTQETNCEESSWDMKNSCYISFLNIALSHRKRQNLKLTQSKEIKSVQENDTLASLLIRLGLNNSNIFEFPNTHIQKRGAHLAGTISLIQQITSFSCRTGKPSRSISHRQATEHSLELLLRGNVSSHGNAGTGLNTWQKTTADRL